MSSVSGISKNGLNFTGLATGIDTSTIIAGLTKFNQQRIDTLKTRQAAIGTKQATFASLQGRLLDLQTKANTLARSAGGAFDGRKATSSDETALTVAAGTAAVPGTYSLTVASVAKPNQTSSAGYADPNATIKQGTISLQVGGGTATTITIDSRNNTLQGLADAINSAGGDVRANIVNDGSASPYRLLLSTAKTGAANTIAVTNNLNVGTDATVDPLATTVQAATDAQIVLGSGTGALTITSPTNVVNNLIPGTTLNLLRADPAKPVVITVANDTAATVKATQDFVDAYNGVREFVNERSQYDPATKQSGVLLGNRDAVSLGDDLAAALAATIPGLNPGANRLSSVGLAFDTKGKLTFDAAKLTQALDGQSGVPAADLKNLFALSGSSDNPGVAFSIGTSKTKPSNGSPFQVQITAPATRAVVVSAGAPGNPITISPANNSIQMKLNGLLAAGITLDSGTYTVDELAAVIQRKINSSASLNGNLVSVGVQGGKLAISTQAYGSSAKIEITGGTALADLGFSGAESGTGTNVAGSFTVNGKTETATGSGQTLSGASGNANTDGLQVRSSLAAPGTANVSVNQGLASRLAGVLVKYVDPVEGRFKAINDTFTQNSKDIDATIAKQNAFLASKTADLQIKFAAMESAVNSLKGVQTQLTSLVAR